MNAAKGATIYSSAHTPGLIELADAVRKGKRLADGADTLLHYQAQLFALTNALHGLQDAIDRKMAYLNPGRQTENWLSPVLEEAIEVSRSALGTVPK